MACIHGTMNGMPFIASVGDGEYEIQVGGRRWRFEDHRIFGPMPIHRRTGIGIDGTKSFWEAVTFWAQQGRRVENGLAIWERPQPEPLFHITGKHYAVSAAEAARLRGLVGLPPVCDCSKCQRPAAPEERPE